MLVRLLDAEGEPVWVNAKQVQAVREGGADNTLLLMIGGGQWVVQGRAPEVATQLQDALVGRKYVDFWAS